MGTPLRQTPLGERVRQLHERLVDGDVAIRKPVTEEPRGRRAALVPAELRATFESWITAGESREAIAARFGVTPEQVATYARNHHLPTPPSAAPSGPIRGERIPIPQRASRAPRVSAQGFATDTGATVGSDGRLTVRPGLSQDAPGEPRAPDSGPDVAEHRTEPAESPAATTDALGADPLEVVEWAPVGERLRDVGMTLHVGASRWYLSAAAVHALDPAQRVRIGRLRDGRVVIVPSAERVGALTITSKRRDTNGAQLSGHALRGWLPQGRHPLRAVGTWLVVEVAPQS